MKKGFTLIELVVAITIIGMLATAITLRLQGSGAKGRDNKRQADLLAIQSALELHFATNRSLPSTVGRTGCQTNISSPPFCGEASARGSYGYEANGYVLNLVPNFIAKLPSDPRFKTPSALGKAAGCDETNSGYAYASNGTDYKIIAECTIEIAPSITDTFFDPARTTWAFALYTAGARNW